MSQPVRLAKRLIALRGCSRREAELYIEGGWVRVDGVVVDEPQYKVAPEQQVELDPAAKAEPGEPATLLYHQPVVMAQGPWRSLDLPTFDERNRAAEDCSGIRLARRHFHRLHLPMPLDAGASGLIVLTQDWRVWRRLTEDAAKIEQEYVVEVAGSLDDQGLLRLRHGLDFHQQPLAPCKVSWQSEHRLRFALKQVQYGQLRHMCTEVGLRVLSIKRIRLGRIPLGRLTPGQWRYLPANERF